MAICKCENGHLYRARILEDDPDTNTITIEEKPCPECGSEEFTIVDEDDDDPPIPDLD